MQSSYKSKADVVQRKSIVVRLGWEKNEKPKLRFSVQPKQTEKFSVKKRKKPKVHKN